MNVLRWILTLPGALLASAILPMISKLLLGTLPEIYHWPIEFITFLSSGYILVASGAWIAPSNKKAVAIPHLIGLIVWQKSWWNHNFTRAVYC
jgi:hypothetical protein